MNAAMIEAILGMVMCIGLFVFGFYQGGIHQKELNATAHAAQLSALADQYQANELQHQQKEAAYEREVITLGSQRLESPDIAVRLCPSTPTANMPSAGTNRHDLPSSTGVLPPQPIPSSTGTDVGPALFSLADYADEIVAKCREQ